MEKTFDIAFVKEVQDGYGVVCKYILDVAKTAFKVYEINMPDSWNLKSWFVKDNEIYALFSMGDYDYKDYFELVMPVDLYGTDVKLYHQERIAKQNGNERRELKCLQRKYKNANRN